MVKSILDKFRKKKEPERPTRLVHFWPITINDSSTGFVVDLSNRGVKARMHSMDFEDTVKVSIRTPFGDAVTNGNIRWRTGTHVGIELEGSDIIDSLVSL